LEFAARDPPLSPQHFLICSKLELNEAIKDGKRVKFTKIGKFRHMFLRNSGQIRVSGAILDRRPGNYQFIRQLNA
jgi:hypothetical protein